MSSPETFLAYGAIMLIIALVGVAIDWFGKPLRHRKFIPKAFKFPDERQFRSEIFNTKPAVTSPGMVNRSEIQNNEQLLQQENSQRSEAVLLKESPDKEASWGSVRDLGPAQESSERPNNGKPTESTLKDDAKSSLPEESSLAPNQTGLIRLQGWSPGGYIYNLKQNGTEPSPSTVRVRFWKNVGVAAGSALFGSKNVARLRDGKPPLRHNPRTGKIETMKVFLLSYEEGKGATPIPHWPTNTIDPFEGK